ncbi:MAG: L-threonylcarbamoyladenylate synthase [Verrucomicrobiota bacterium]
MNTQILSGSDESHLDLFVDSLRQGLPIAVPTETVYGLAAPATDESALEQIYKIKGRPLNDPLILHIADPSWLSTWATDFDPGIVAKLAEMFWPGPLTLVLKKQDQVPDLATAGLPTAGFRIPRHPDFLEIIQRCRVPLAAPSANPFSYISPTRAEHVLATLGGQIPYIVDGGPCEEGIESTILDLSNPEHPKILRPGPIASEDIAKVLNTESLAALPKKPESHAQLAPGNFSKHYAPRKPISATSVGDRHPFTQKDALLFCRPAQKFNPQGPAKSFNLGDPSDIRAIRRNLYHTLNSLDADTSVERIFLVDWPNTFNDPGLDDRVRRALSQG